MVTLQITLEDSSIIPSLKTVLSRIKGITSITAKREVGAFNRTTLLALKELESGQGHRAKNVKDLFDQLNA